MKFLAYIKYMLLTISGLKFSYLLSVLQKVILQLDKNYWDIFFFALFSCSILPRNMKIRIKTKHIFKTENNMCNFMDIKDSNTEFRIVSGTN